jgi:hypothetical protein
VHISQCSSLLDKRQPSLYAPPDIATVSPDSLSLPQPWSCPPHTTQRLELLDRLRVCHTPAPAQTTSTSSSRSADPAYLHTYLRAQIAKDSTTSDKSAPPVETATLEISRRHTLPFGQLQDLHVSFNQIATGPLAAYGPDRSQQSLDSARHLTTDVAAARYQGRLADQCLSVRLHRAIRDLWRREEAKRT